MQTWMSFGLGAAALLVVGCGAAPQGDPGAGGGSGAPGNGGGGSASTGGSPQGGGGTHPSGSGGASQGNGFDDGKLFQDAGPVTAPPAEDAGTGPADAGPKPEAGGPPADGTTATAKVGSLGLDAVFTQKGADVILVVTATKCPAGSHAFRIHEGFACDDPTNKPVWGGKRGDGISPLVCGADQKGTFTYTRSGADPTLKWTIGDQSLTTDVTLHPIFVDNSCGTFF
ncbi:MAG: hypothetical protein QOI66_2408 [Myxococcales bacterium]|nr:hypothetical protein [Myxococcales bacterium]